MREFLVKKTGILLTSTLLTFIVLIESLYPIPWSPYFLIYAALAILIPYSLKTYSFGKFKDVLNRYYKFLIIFIIITLIYEYLMDFILNTFLIVLNKVGDPYTDFNAALQLLASKAGEKFGITTDDAFAIYAIYILVWAPIGEELFYRGYIYGELRKENGFITAVLISSFFFGIRHVTHFFFITPVPIIPGLWWALHAFIFGVIMAYTYEKTGSLYIPMIIHFLANLIPALI